MAKLTPMLRQYLEVKERYPDAIVFFRMGDFYEMFFEDAVIAARVLEIALTSRDKGAKEKVPMCGVPVVSASTYLARLVQAGYKVAICEQVEDPKEAKGLVRREVVRVVTPGLYVEDEGLESKSHNFIVCILLAKSRAGLAVVDLSTGHFQVTEVSPDEALGELFRLEPRELLLPEALRDSDLVAKIIQTIPSVFLSFEETDGLTLGQARELLKEHYQVASLSGFGLEGFGPGLLAAALLLRYLSQTQKGALPHLRPPLAYHLSQFLLIDETSKRNLELLKSLTGERRGSLLSVIDRTRTPMGGRLLKHWILYPLLDKASIEERLEAVGRLLENRSLREDLGEALKEVYDLERLNARVAMKTATPKDLLALKASLEKIPRLKKALAAERGLLRRLTREMDALPGLVDLLSRAIREEAPASLKDGGVIKEGFDPELDEYLRLRRDAKGMLAEIEKRERERTGIANLKVGFNKVFGYYIEVTKSQLARVPEDYIRKQTLVSAERFITPELKVFEEKALSAEERSKALEIRIFEDLRKKVAASGSRIQATAQAVACLDCLVSLAELAEEGDYCRPEITEEPLIEIEEGRHPVVEAHLPKGSFVPNSLRLDHEENLLLIITGPNMAGKSTILRQTALIVLLAQMGSFVPAKRARIGLVDRIFTRVGASDALSRGQSTFMVEMTECAHILHQATNRSLVILDEIGRGTATYDGLSIAWAVAEYLLEKDGQGVKTLFATHYHELTEMVRLSEKVKNFNIAVKEWNDQVIFLHRLQPGPANRSYGIQVASLAGVPRQVIKRAKEILARLEAGEFELLVQVARRASKRPPVRQLDLFSPENLLKRRLLEIDIDQTTPIEALNLLAELKRLAEEA
ncbi:DNA mismatch repair protein MutS [Thermosulfuriphilus sp.]